MQEWLSYFERNASRADRVPWQSSGNALSQPERRAIESSIAVFQLGESSEGRNLMKFAKEWAEIHGEPLLVPITRYFIREEQRHAALLLRFMRSSGIAAIEKAWTDVVFRRLRSRAGYELSITVLIVAELIALVYYDSLGAATASPVLRAICEQILEEERVHVRYQVERIEAARARHSSLRRRVTRLAHRLLYAGTVLVVFPTHRHVLRRAGLNLPSYWRRCWTEMNAAFSRPSLSSDQSSLDHAGPESFPPRTSPSLR
jgi:hypothetical protein